MILGCPRTGAGFSVWAQLGDGGTTIRIPPALVL